MKIKNIFIVGVLCTDGWWEWVDSLARHIYICRLWGNRNDFTALSLVKSTACRTCGSHLTTHTQKQKPTKRSVCVFGGSGWIRTTSVVRQQIYSLPRLSNSGARPKLVTCHTKPLAKRGAGSGTRTRISSLEGLRTSPCTMPATNSKPTDYT